MKTSGTTADLFEKGRIFDNSFSIFFNICGAYHFRCTDDGTYDTPAPNEFWPRCSAQQGSKFIKPKTSSFLTEVGAYPKLPTQPIFFFYHFQTYTASYNGHSELSREEKSKFVFEGKKFSLLLKVEFSRQKCLQTSLFSNKLNFFSLNSNFDFSSRDNSE